MNLDTGELYRKAKVQNTHILSDEELNMLQSQLLQIAKDIVSFCNDNNIWVSLCGGSALGAIRHKGFIPWDDDFDVCMTRESYQKFAKLFINRYKDYYYGIDYNGDYFNVPMQKIMKKNTVYKRPNNIDDNKCGVWVDIWILENTFNNTILRNVHGCLCVLFTALLSCEYTNKNWEKIEKFYYDNNELIKKLKIKRMIGRIFSFININSLEKTRISIFKLCKNNFSKYISIPNGRKKFFRELYIREAFIPTISVSFGNTIMPLTNDYLNYFNILYGKDYMVLPDEKNREKHSVIELKL